MGTFAGRAASVAFVRDGHNDQIEVYLTRRPGHFRYYPRAFVFPGGRADVDDTDLRITAFREVQEEIGVEIEPERLTLLRETYTSAHAGPVYHLFIFAYVVVGDLATQPNQSEVDEEVWLSAREALSLLELPYQVRAAVWAIAGFNKVDDLMRALSRGPINEDWLG